MRGPATTLTIKEPRPSTLVFLSIGVDGISPLLRQQLPCWAFRRPSDGFCARKYAGPLSTGLLRTGGSALLPSDVPLTIGVSTHFATAPVTLPSAIGSAGSTRRDVAELTRPYRRKEDGF